jgi:antitoxin component YwqK of YwqJK toxin-antitoxin module
MKKLSLTLLTCLLFLSPNVVLSETMKDLVKREGIYYKRFSQVPFTGEVTGFDQGLFKNGKKDGSWARYFLDGQLWEKGNWKNGEAVGVWVEYYTGGWLRSKGKRKNGKKEGAWVTYNPDGTVWDNGTGTFKNGEKISD